MDDDSGWRCRWICPSALDGHHTAPVPKCFAELHGLRKQHDDGCLLLRISGGLPSSITSTLSSPAPLELW
uniref:Uncharacterized protein n=1 Tax=Oryza punctata TaxID=4537 RepID=A0A0E0LKE4_ORYPU